jgi:hypothetical protein
VRVANEKGPGESFKRDRQHHFAFQAAINALDRGERAGAANSQKTIGV